MHFEISASVILEFRISSLSLESILISSGSLSEWPLSFKSLKKLCKVSRLMFSHPLSSFLSIVLIIFQNSLGFLLFCLRNFRFEFIYKNVHYTFVRLTCVFKIDFICM